MTEPGESQNSASSGVIFNTRMFGSWALSHHAFAGVENNCLILARSLADHVITVGWLAIDPAAHYPRWVRADAKDRLAAHNRWAQSGRGALLEDSNEFQQRAFVIVLQAVARQDECRSQPPVSRDLLF